MIGFVYLIPILLLDFKEKKRRWLFTTVWAYFCFLIANNARIHIYTSILNEEMYSSLKMIVPVIMKSIIQSVVIIPEHIWGIGERLYGCQCFVIGKQLQLPTG